MVNKRSVFELGVEEAHAILSTHRPSASLPPLDAIENEDWGRNLVLSRIWELEDHELESLGLTRADAEPGTEPA